MCMFSVAPNEDKVLPRAITLKVEVFLNSDALKNCPPYFVADLESRLEALISAPVSVEIAKSTVGDYLLVLSELGSITPEFANTLMFTAAETVAVDFGVVGKIEVRYGPLKVELNWLEDRSAQRESIGWK